MNEVTKLFKVHSFYKTKSLNTHCKLCAEITFVQISMPWFTWFTTTNKVVFGGEKSPKALFIFQCLALINEALADSNTVVHIH